VGDEPGEELLRIHGHCAGRGPVALVGAIGELLGRGVVGEAVQGQGVAGAVAGEAQRKRTVTLAHRDAGMDVEARVGPPEHRPGLILVEEAAAHEEPEHGAAEGLLVEHPPVVTLGRGRRETSLPLDPESLKRRGIEVFAAERGGDVTYHGPGQLVGYPIFDLRQHRQDPHWYLRQIEAALIAALGAFGIEAERDPDYTGEWTKGRKITSIGVHAKQWVTWHGFALNVATDLSPFDLIIPCGIPGEVMTSVERELAGEEAQRHESADGQRTANLSRAVRGLVTESLVNVPSFEGWSGLTGDLATAIRYDVSSRSDRDAEVPPPPPH
jgi:lipoyl(octanoyl) transferase